VAPVDPDPASVVWGNLLHLAYLVEDLLLHSKPLQSSSEDRLIPRWLSQVLEYELSSDLKLLNVYAELLAPLFHQPTTDLSNLVKAIHDPTTVDHIKTALPILFFEPTDETLAQSDRGCFLRIIVTLF
jgi:hypothetical protein